MKKIISIFLLIPLLISCAPTQATGIGTTCDSLQPTDGDIAYALNFGSSLFTEAVWNRSYTVRELDMIVNWTHRSVAALSDVSLLLFCNENGTADLELFFNETTIQEGLANYDSTTIVNSCAKEDVILYELDAVEEGANYTIKQWIQTLSTTRLLNVIMVFPKEETVLIDKYSQELFPTLPACE